MKTSTTPAHLVAFRNKSIAVAMKRIRRDAVKRDLVALVLECVADDDWALLEIVARKRGKIVDDEKRANGVIDIERMRKVRLFRLGGS